MGMNVRVPYQFGVEDTELSPSEHAREFAGFVIIIMIALMFSMISFCCVRRKFLEAQRIKNIKKSK